MQLMGEDINGEEELDLKAEREEWLETLQPIQERRGVLAYFADVAFVAERVRVGAQVRIKHLAKVGRRCKDTEKLFALAQAVEDFVDGRLAALVEAHPTWPWASRSKGIGHENYPKVVGLIEAFGTYYDPGDPRIPLYVDREPEPYKKVVKGKIVDKIGIWVEGIERLATASKKWKYEGLAVVDGHAQRREAGTKVGWNTQLRMAYFRLGTSLMRAGGVWYTGGQEPEQSKGYVGSKDYLESRYLVEGRRIVPTPKERTCIPCDLVVQEKATRYCPQCGGKLSLKKEPPGVIYLGHLHSQALRMMVKDFSLCQWIVWRQALRLPMPEPYSARMGRTPLDPWKMVDR